MRRIVGMVVHWWHSLPHFDVGVSAKRIFNHVGKLNDGRIVFDWGQTVGKEGWRGWAAMGVEWVGWGRSDHPTTTSASSCTSACNIEC